MTIDPIHTGHTFGHREVQQSEGPESGQDTRGPEARAAGHDRVEVSSIGRELAKRIEAAGPPGLEISAERLEQIAKRLAEGHYNSPEIRGQVAEAIFNELRGG